MVKYLFLLLVCVISCAPPHYTFEDPCIEPDGEYTVTHEVIESSCRYDPAEGLSPLVVGSNPNCIQYVEPKECNSNVSEFGALCLWDDLERGAEADVFTTVVWNDDASVGIGTQEYNVYSIGGYFICSATYSVTLQ